MASFVRLLTAYDKHNTMNSLTVVVLCVALAAANAAIIGGAALVGPAEPGAVLQGPGASATVHGPEGSIIAANQPGGTVVSAAKSAGVVSLGAPAIAAAPIVAARVAAPYAHPAVVAHHGAVVGAPVIARAGFPLLAPGSGIEGQYVPDNTELLFDNGQYHGEIYP